MSAVRRRLNVRLCASQSNRLRLPLTKGLAEHHDLPCPCCSEYTEEERNPARILNDRVAAASLIVEIDLRERSILRIEDDRRPHARLKPAKFAAREVSFVGDRRRSWSSAECKSGMVGWC